MSDCEFRYVPQIEQVGLDQPITKRQVMMLLERDRQLEDFLGNNCCASGLQALLTVRRTSSVQLSNNGWVGVEVQWQATDPEGFGTAISWDVSAPTKVRINEDGYYGVAAGVGLAHGLLYREGPVWGGWLEYTRGVQGSWSYGGTYFYNTTAAVLTTFAVPSTTLRLHAGDEIRLWTGHDVYDVRPPGAGTLANLTIDGANQTTFLTVEKLG